MTKAEAISRVRVGIKELNADSRLTKKYIFSSLQSKIRILISQNSDGLKLIRDNTIFQTLKCVKLSPVPTIDECCGIKTKCQIWRTDDRLPKMYTDEDGVIVKNIVSIDGTTDFDLTTPTAIRRMLLNVNSKYDTNKYCFYSDGYLYVVKEKVPLTSVQLVKIGANEGVTNPPETVNVPNVTAPTCVDFI